MARRGGTFEQILDKYFPGARVSAAPHNTKAQSETDMLVAPEGQLLFASLGAASRQSLSNEHLRVAYPARVPRPEIEAAIRILEAARRDMEARRSAAQLSLPAYLDVTFHETTQDFTASTGQPWWVAGVTRLRRIELQPVAVLKRRRILVSTLRHEYAHAVIEANGGSGVPRWLAEGLAITFAGEGPNIMRFKSKAQLPIDTLERRLARPESSSDMRELYAAAYYEVRLLIRKEGEPAVWRRVATQATTRSSRPRSIRADYSL